MIAKTLFYTAIVASIGFTFERNIIGIPSLTTRGTDIEFVSATEIPYSLGDKRGVFGQDDQSRFFSLYEKDPNQPGKTFIKFVRANKDRQNNNLLEYVECDSSAMPGELDKDALFLLTSDEIRKRLAQDGPTY
jgi:hypothetical protein